MDIINVPFNPNNRLKSGIKMKNENKMRALKKHSNLSFFYSIKLEKKSCSLQQREWVRLNTRKTKKIGWFQFKDGFLRNKNSSFEILCFCIEIRHSNAWALNDEWWFFSPSRNPSRLKLFRKIVMIFGICICDLTTC